MVGRKKLPQLPYEQLLAELVTFSTRATVRYRRDRRIESSRKQLLLKLKMPAQELPWGREFRATFAPQRKQLSRYPLRQPFEIQRSVKGGRRFLAYLLEQRLDDRRIAVR